MQLERVRWSLIPAVTFAGAVSAIVSTLIWFPAVSTKSEILFPVLASLSFALTIGAVLWFYRLIRTWMTFVAIVGVTIAAHLVKLYGDPHLRMRLPEWVDIPVGGSIDPAVAIMSFSVALIVFVAFMLLTTPRARVGWAAVFGFVCALLNATTVAFVDGTQKQAWFSFLRGDEIGFLWQPALAFFLAIALSVKGMAAPFHSRAEEEPHPSSKILFAAFAILAVAWAIAGTWVSSFRVREKERIAEIQTRENQEIAEAPSLGNLSAPTPRRPEEMLLLQEIDGWKPYLSGSQEWPAQNANRYSESLPERRTYYARYATAGNNSAVVANVTEYPNADWAKYAVKNTPTAHVFIDDPGAIKTLVQSGNRLFQDGPYVFWASDRNLILLDCEGVLPEVIDEFLTAYLTKYPSSL